MDRECGIEIILRLINRIGSRYIWKYFSSSPLVLERKYIINSMRDEFFKFPQESEWKKNIQNSFVWKYKNIPVQNKKNIKFSLF